MHRAQSPNAVGGRPRCGRGTAFILAAYSGRVDAAAALIFAGADVTTTDMDGWGAQPLLYQHRTIGRINVVTSSDLCAWAGSLRRIWLA